MLDQHFAPELVINATLYILLLFSVLTWSMILFKAWQFSKNRYYNKQFTTLFWEKTDLTEARMMTPKARGPLARIARQGFNWLVSNKQATEKKLKFYGVPEELLEHTLRVQMQKEHHTMEHGLAMLASIGSTAPFVGLFGTVLGIMHAMHEITASGSTSLDVVAGPIGDALVATAIGIAVAVPAVLAYNFFLRRLKLHKANLENFVIAFLQMAFSSRSTGRFVMAFKPQSDDQDVMNEINVTPLVDVMLVLVIILLVTAPLLTQSVHVTLPKTTTTTPDVKEQPLQLAIDARETVTLNKTPYADLAALEAALKNELAQNAELAVHLYADEAVTYKKVAEVMAHVQHAGINKLAFVTIEQ